MSAPPPPPGPEGTRPLALARARRLRRCGRAVLLWTLGLYLAAQAALLLVLDRWRPTLAVTVCRDKWRQLRQLAAREPERPLLVMLGSSRTEMALQAGRLSGLPGPDGRPFLAYNFGVPQAGPLHHGLYLGEMLDAGIRPRLLLVEFLPPLFNEPGRGLTSEEDWTSAPWLSAAQLLRLWPYFARPGRKGRDWLEGRLAPGYAFRQVFHTALLERLSPGGVRPEGAPHDPWGWRLPEPLTAEECARFRGLAHRLFSPSLRRFRLGKGPSRALRDLLERCRRERIPVVLVLTPESATFRSWYSPEALAAPGRLLAEVREAYGVPVIDASGWVADRDFIDGHHLLAGGARVFTTRLREELRRFLARPGPADRTGSAPPAKFHFCRYGMPRRGARRLSAGRGCS
jgi:hypothetical protein